MNSVTAEDMAIANDALIAAKAGVAEYNSASVQTESSISEVGVLNSYQSLLEHWDADKGMWTVSGLHDFDSYLQDCKADAEYAGTIWDSQFDLGVRVITFRMRIKSSGDDPQPGLLAVAGDKISRTYESAKESVSNALSPIFPGLKNIGTYVMWGAIALGVILILYAVGPSLQAGASIYRTSKED